MRIDVGRFVKGLTQPLRQSCESSLAGNISEGARAAGIHRSTAHDWIARLRARAAAQGLDAYFVSRSDSSVGSPVNGTDSSNLQEPWGMGVSARTVGVRLLLTEAELGHWLVQARPGEA